MRNISKMRMAQMGGGGRHIVYEWHCESRTLPQGLTGGAPSWAAGGSLILAGVFNIPLPTINNNFLLTVQASSHSDFSHTNNPQITVSNQMGVGAKIIRNSNQWEYKCTSAAFQSSGKPSNQQTIIKIGYINGNFTLNIDDFTVSGPGYEPDIYLRHGINIYSENAYTYLYLRDITLESL